MRGEWDRWRPRPPDSPTDRPKVPSRDLAELRATALLAMARIAKPPVDVERIADTAGIDLITYSDLSERHSAMMMRTEGRVGLVINRTQPRVRQRFSIAHEIGHWVLERVPETKDLAPVAMRSRRYDEVERICNYFAACLLMPANWIRERADGGMTNAELAKAFEVSPQALVHRLGELGYYQRGGPRG